MSARYAFSALIQTAEDMDAAYIEFPYDAEKEFGKQRVPVKVLFDGHPYRGLLTNMGTRCHIVGINKKIRAAIGKHPGDTVSVVIEEDVEERSVSLPTDFSRALNDSNEAASFFTSLAFSRKRAVVQWIETAKKAETRARRITQAVALLAAKTVFK